MIPSETVGLLASKSFDLGTVLQSPVAVAEAWSNQVFRVVTSSGQYAVKVFTGTPRRALTTGRLVEAAAAATGRIPMPAPVAAADGGWFVQIESPHAPQVMRCHRWVDGTPGSVAASSAAIARDVGRSLGVLHALRLDGGDSSQLPPVEMDRWHRAATDVTGAHIPWAHQVNDLTPLVEHLTERVDHLRRARLPVRLSHDDLDPKNAVVRRDGRVAITDWDNAGPVLPDVELVVAATSFAGGGASADAELVRDFVFAYRDAGGDVSAIDPEVMVVETGKIDWMLRNIEGALRPRPGDDMVGGQTAQELIASFADDVTRLRDWATRISSL